MTKCLSGGDAFSICQEFEGRGLQWRFCQSQRLTIQHHYVPGKHPNSSEDRNFWLWPPAWSLERKVGIAGHPLPHESIVQKGKEAQELYLMYFMLAIAHPVDFISSFLIMAILPKSRQKKKGPWTYYQHKISHLILNHIKLGVNLIVGARID